MTEIEERLEFLQRTNVIEGLQKYNHRYRFYWNKQRKTLVCYDGKQGRSDTFTPSEIGTNSIDAIMTRKFRSVPDSIREEVMKRYIPALKHGAYVHKDFLVQSEAFTPVTKHWLQYL